MDTAALSGKKRISLSPAKKGAVAAAAGMLMFFAFSVIVFRWSALSALAAVLFQLLCVALPGIAVTKLLKIALTPLESLCVSYGFGFSVVVLVYFPFGLMRRTELIPFALLAVSILSIVALVFTRKRPFTSREDRGELSIALAACFFTAAITLSAFSAGFLDPSLSGLHYYYHDALNAVSLTASAKLGYPFHFLQMAGVTYWYHPFTYFYTASMSLCTGISAFDVTTKLLIFTVTPFAMSTITAIAMRVTGSRKYTLLATALGCFFPASGLYYYLFEDLLGFMPGLAFGAMAILTFMEAQSISKKINPRHLLSVFFMCMCLGAKGPVAVPIIFGICFALLMQLITEKDLWVFPKGLAYAVPFFFLYWYLYGTAVDESMELFFAHVAMKTDFARWLMGVMGVTAGSETILYKLLCAVYYCITSYPVIFIAFVLGIVVLIKAGGKNTFAAFTTGAAALGFVFVNMFRQAGSSELYFHITSYWFAAVLVIYVIQQLWKSDRKKILAAAVSVLTLAVCISSGRYFIPTIIDGVQNSIVYSYYSPAKLDTEEEMNAFFRRGASLSPEEYEGYIFMRDNLPDTAVICDYRYNGYNKCFFGCAFSEKMFLLEGWGYVTMEDTNDNTFEKGQRDNYISSFYEMRDEGFIPILREFGATHIVITEYFTPDWELSTGYTNLIFENDSIRIYEIII